MSLPLLQSFLENYPNGIAQITSANPGPTLTLIAFTHGNEVAGIHAFAYLMNEYKIQDKLKCGTVQFVIGNIAAALVDKRCVEKDFNRVWDFSDQDANTIEYKRAEEIKETILRSDILLDIHSTSKPSIPMGLLSHSNQVPNALLDTLITPYLVYDIFPFLHGKSLVSFVQEKKPKAICLAIESGQHTETESIQSAIANSLVLLSHAQMIEPLETQIHIKKKLIVKKAIHAKSLEVKFPYSDSPKSFDTIPANTPFVFDGDTELFTEYETVILMPSMPTYIGEEIAYLSQEII